MTRFARPLAALCATLAAAWAFPAAAAPSESEAPVRAIAIVVNGEELPRDPAPRVVAGRLLVPVFRIYGALGIAVARDGDTVVASAPGRRIAVTDGSARAQLDTRTIVMEAPARRIDGATFVPLRFLADSLGAQVTYDPKAARVEVASTIVGRTPGLEQRTASGSTQLVGTLSAVDLTSNPESVTVVRGPSVRTVPIPGSARIAIQDVATRTETPATLDALHPGDAVAIVQSADGKADRVTARYASRSGTIAAVAPTQFVLGSGVLVIPDKGTAITLNGAPAQLADLRVGDAVTVRVNPDTGEKRQILAAREVPATPQPADGVQIASVTTSASRPLRAGDLLVVTLRGTPGGRATFDLGTYLTGMPMSETSPGLYTARYIVPPAVNFDRSAVYGYLTVAGKNAPRAQAGRLVAVSTTPPQIVEIGPGAGDTVNNPRPSMYATFRSPTGAGIDASSARIHVNGLDVTPVATRTDGFITYMPSAALGDGPVTVVVSVADNAGNVQQRRWTFTVRAR